MNYQPVVIIGSGLAGYAVARELRKLNTEIPVIMLSADHGGFYSKPMLSNALATGKTPASILTSDAALMSSQLKITIRPFTRVNTIDQSGNSILLENGENLSYSHLVLALGADPIRLLLSGGVVEEVLSVNDLDDYRRFREALKDKKEIAILGAGLIGCEFANDLAISGYQVHVIDMINYHCRYDSWHDRYRNNTCHSCAYMDGRVSTLFLLAVDQTYLTKLAEHHYARGLGQGKQSTAKARLRRAVR